MDTGSAVTLNFCAEGSDLELNYASGHSKAKIPTSSTMTKAICLPRWPNTSHWFGLTYAVPLGAGNDCDDTDPNVGPEDLDGDGSSTRSGDCDDNDPSVFGYDIDGDGYTTCEGDCNESLDDLDNDGVADGFAINPDAVEIYGDGIDQNCDGLSDYDADGDGDDSINDGGTDCDDTDASVDGLDVDGDGFTTCPDVNTGLSDCDDLDEFTYPGAAYLDSTTDCLTDVDGDGLSPFLLGGCFTLEMQDSWGDGWNGALTITIDGCF